MFKCILMPKIKTICYATGLIEFKQRHCLFEIKECIFDASWCKNYFNWKLHSIISIKVEHLFVEQIIINYLYLYIVSYWHIDGVTRINPYGFKLVLTFKRHVYKFDSCRIIGSWDIALWVKQLWFIVKIWIKKNFMC
jgi:hypothetical protein